MADDAERLKILIDAGAERLESDLCNLKRGKLSCGPRADADRMMDRAKLAAVFVELAGRLMNGR